MTNNFTTHLYYNQNFYHNKIFPHSNLSSSLSGSWNVDDQTSGSAITDAMLTDFSGNTNTGSILGSPAISETTINIAGWGAKSGPLRSFGVNSEAILKAAVDRVNQTGGVTLADGSKAKMAFTYYDSGCNAEQGIAVARKVASETNALIGIGPTCSGVAAARFGIFQK